MLLNVAESLYFDVYVYLRYVSCVLVNSYTLATQILGDHDKIQMVLVIVSCSALTL